MQAALWLWAHRNDLRAAIDDAALLLFLIIITGVSYRTLLDLGNQFLY